MSSILPPVPAFESQLLHVQDQKVLNTPGGTFTSGAWRVRELSSVLTNEIPGASVALNIITLPAGTYFAMASAPANVVNEHQARIETAGAAVLLYGTVAREPLSEEWNGRSFVNGRFTLTSGNDIVLTHRCVTTRATDGFGNPGNVPTSARELYSELMLWKVR